MDDLTERASKLGYDLVEGKDAITVWSGHLICFVGSRDKVVDLIKAVEKRATPNTLIAQNEL